jgi:hypothetical protein
LLQRSGSAAEEACSLQRREDATAAMMKWQRGCHFKGEGKKEQGMAQYLF